MITIRGKQREEETQREENKGQKMIIGELEHILTNTFTPTRSVPSAISSRHPVSTGNTPRVRQKQMKLVKL